MLKNIFVIKNLKTSHCPVNFKPQYPPPPPPPPHPTATFRLTPTSPYMQSRVSNKLANDLCF